MTMQSKIFATVLRSETLLCEMQYKLARATAQKLPKGAANELHNLARDIKTLVGDIAYLKELVNT